MNLERLVREIERRLEALSPEVREVVAEILREELHKERRRTPGPLAVVEVERERRVQAEALREVAEAVTHQASLQETIDEVLRQLGKLVRFDSASVALLDSDGRFRIIAARGFEDPARVVGQTYKDATSEALRGSLIPLSLADVTQEAGFSKVDDGVEIRSWAGVPLRVEGETIGMLCLDRWRIDPFDEEDLHRARAVAFSAAAAIRKEQLLVQLRRYATLMERVVRVDQAALADRDLAAVSRLTLEGALVLGGYPGGMLVLGEPGQLTVAAASGPFAAALDREAPATLHATEPHRLAPAAAVEAAAALGLPAVEQGLWVVPVSTGEHQAGTLVLIDPDGDTPDDRLLVAFASRAADAILHTIRGEARS
jgi:GAF domain-containing protein